MSTLHSLSVRFLAALWVFSKSFRRALFGLPGDDFGLEAFDFVLISDPVRTSSPRFKYFCSWGDDAEFRPGTAPPPFVQVEAPVK